MIHIFYSLPELVTLRLRNPHQSERESAYGRRQRRKKRKQHLYHGGDSNPRPQSPESSALSTRPWRPAHLPDIKRLAI